MRLVRNVWPGRAVDLLRPGAEAGQVDALVELTLITADVRPAELPTWLDQLIQTGDASAMAWVGQRLEKTHRSEALDLYRAAAAQSNSEALARLLVLDRGPESEAREAQLIASGDIAATAAAAGALESADADAAIRLYRAAASSGAREVIPRLAVLLADRDPEESLQWQAQLSGASDSQLLWELASEIQPRDEERAVAIYRIAAEGGSTAAALALVVLMADRDDAGFVWARQRLVEAKAPWDLFNAARQLDDRDSPKAVLLYQDAVDAGNSAAEPRLKKLLAASSSSVSSSEASPSSVEPGAPDPPQVSTTPEAGSAQGAACSR